MAYAAHMETAVEQPATSWYLAEGATHGSFDLFYLILNPSSTAADIRVRYLKPSGSPIVKTYSVGAGSRFTIWVDQEDQALRATDVSAEITSTNGVPIIVERSMYLNTGSKAFKGGHNSAGVTSPSLNWFLAEGSTGGFFSMYMLLANPNATAATVRATYILASGAPVVKTYSVAANSRRTIDVAGEDRALADTAGVGEGRVDQRRAGHRRAHHVVDGVEAQLDGRPQCLRDDPDGAALAAGGRRERRSARHQHLRPRRQHLGRRRQRPRHAAAGGGRGGIGDLHGRRQPPLHGAGGERRSRRRTASASRSWSRA